MLDVSEAEPVHAVLQLESPSPPLPVAEQSLEDRLLDWCLSLADEKQDFALELITASLDGDPFPDVAPDGAAWQRELLTWFPMILELRNCDYR